MPQGTHTPRLESSGNEALLVAAVSSLLTPSPPRIPPHRHNCSVNGRDGVGEWHMLKLESKKIEITFSKHCWKLVGKVNVAGFQRRGKRKIPEKIRRPAASSGAIPTCENLGVTRPGIEAGSPWCEASSLTTQPPWPLDFQFFLDTNRCNVMEEGILRTTRLLASHQDEPGSIPGWATPDFRKWESWRTMPLVVVFSRDLPFLPPLHSGFSPFSPYVTLIGSQDFVVKSHPNLSTQSCFIVPTSCSWVRRNWTVVSSVTSTDDNSRIKRNLLWLRGVASPESDRNYFWDFRKPGSVPTGRRVLRLLFESKKHGLKAGRCKQTKKSSECRQMPRDTRRDKQTLTFERVYASHDKRHTGTHIVDCRGERVLPSQGRGVTPIKKGVLLCCHPTRRQRSTATCQPRARTRPHALAAEDGNYSLLPPVRYHCLIVDQVPDGRGVRRARGGLSETSPPHIRLRRAEIKTSRADPARGGGSPGLPRMRRWLEGEGSWRRRSAIGHEAPSSARREVSRVTRGGRVVPQARRGVDIIFRPSSCCVGGGAGASRGVHSRARRLSMNGARGRRGRAITP
ncbi:hypothetical protein PR048_001045 [Dryococelus australis]|uniref:Uncharacterized protein n=1 Tax=Dryococelus australis TaxID=614101 RepID=A0ABQ9IG99_9NEOP|nr:hypothetical protein PR048_001045 [Dryococelus australis]